MSAIILADSTQKAISRIKDESVQLVFVVVPRIPQGHPQGRKITRHLQGILKECKRTLKPAGLLAVYTHIRQRGLCRDIGREASRSDFHFEAPKTLFEFRRTWARTWEDRIYLELFSDNSETLRNVTEPRKGETKKRKLIHQYLLHAADMDWYAAREAQTKYKTNDYIRDYASRGDRVFHYTDVNRFSMEDYATTMDRLIRIFTTAGDLILDPTFTRSELISMIAKQHKRRFVAITNSQKTFHNAKDKYDCMFVKG